MVCAVAQEFAAGKLQEFAEVAMAAAAAVVQVGP